MYQYALIRADLNSSESEVISQHKTESAACRALDKLGNVRGYYVATRKANGEFETRLEARESAQRV